MIEFKSAGDAMVFECPAFKIEICADAESIEFADPLHEPIDRVTEAFKVLDMMIEHKARQAHVLHFGVDAAKGEDAAEVIRKLNEYVWKHTPSENQPGHRFREFMKREGL